MKRLLITILTIIPLFVVAQNSVTSADKRAQRAFEVQQRQEREILEIEKRLEEENSWKSAASAYTIEKFSQFIKQYPNSAHVSEAQSHLANLQDEENWNKACAANTVSAYEAYLSNGGSQTDVAYRKIDELYWNQAKEINTIDAYQEYLRRDTDAPKKYSAEAQRRYEELEDQVKWKRADKANSPEAFQTYIATGGKYVQEALAKIDELYWTQAKKSSLLEAYQEYIDRTTDAPKAHIEEAHQRINLLRRQQELLSQAEQTKDAERAYNLAHQARTACQLSSADYRRALSLEEPYMYSAAIKHNASINFRKEYVSTYRDVAPNKHVHSIQKKINKQEIQEAKKLNQEQKRIGKQQARSAKRRYRKQRRAERILASSIRPSNRIKDTDASASTSSSSALDNPYFENNGRVQFTWFGLDGYVGTSTGGVISILDWRFTYLEISPLAVGFNYIPEYAANLNWPALGRSSEGFYYQPSLKFYIPLGSTGSHALTLAGGARLMIEDLRSIRTLSFDDPWFMAEIGYNFNAGLINTNVFARYNGDFVIGLQLKLSHVFTPKQQ